jgi:general stress protein CsbA
MIVYMGDLLFPCILDENRPIIFAEMEQNWYIAIFLVVWKKFASKFERENHKLSSDLRSCVISPFFFFFFDE